MSVETVIIDKLEATAGLTSLVSTDIYLNRAPKSVTPPYITYRQITEDLRYKLNGENDMQSSIFEFTIVATTIGSAKAIAEQLKSALSLVDHTTGTARIHTGFLNTSTMDFDFEYGVHRIIQDYEFFYTLT